MTVGPSLFKTAHRPAGGVAKGDVPAVAEVAGSTESVPATRILPSAPIVTYSARLQAPSTELVGLKASLSA